MIYRRSTLLFALLATALLGSGCSEIRKAAGVDKSPPDEFAVTTRAPLSLPPDYTLRPPKAGRARPQEARPAQQARQSVFSSNQSGVTTASLEQRSTKDGRSLGELALLQKAEALDADAGIRQVVDRESVPVRRKTQTFGEALMFWKKKPNTDTSLDAQAEADRLGTMAPLNRRVEISPPPPSRQVLAQGTQPEQSVAPQAPAAQPAPVVAMGPLVPADPKFADLIMIWDDPDQARARRGQPVRQVTIERQERQLF